MKAVIETGGKQYKVAEGDVIRIEKIAGEPGQEVSFDNVLLLFDDKAINVGQPTVANAVVSGTFVKEDKEGKIIVFKKKRRKGYRLKKGHRQQVSVVKIEKISAAAAKKAAKEEVAQDSKKEADNGA